jgi:uncharacterized repeat protein (TIGR03847 family)
MPNVEIELNPIDFITIGTIGPKGRRVFYLQAGQNAQIVSLLIEKEQSWALSEAINELIDDLDERYSQTTEPDKSIVDMELREPIEPIFRVSQMGLGYDEDQDKVVLVAQELVTSSDEEDEQIGRLEGEQEQPGIVRIWCTREQMRTLSKHAMEMVKAGRADPKQNGRLVYYWT